MVVIKKEAPPRSLVEFQKREGASYDSVDFPRKDVYDALLREQGGPINTQRVMNIGKIFGLRLTPASNGWWTACNMGGMGPLHQQMKNLNATYLRF